MRQNLYIQKFLKNIFTKLEELGFSNRHMNHRVLKCFYKRSNGEPVDINKVVENLTAKRAAWKKWKEPKENVCSSTEVFERPKFCHRRFHPKEGKQRIRNSKSQPIVSQLLLNF
eukprot:TRINITY_DN894_c0_g3_i1.p1 TRINITY_DN894_c0_g3~~TRINITY_DN894_c0_g3_i1.p1  ORF type:complete len:114 (-),score=15.87 TRINITY_DN894_c0_g3_i1:2-343(-)